MISIMTGFTPEVGSSSRMMRGRPISTVANSSSLRWPNESVPARGVGQAGEAEVVQHLQRAAAVGRPHARPKQRAASGCWMAAAMFSITVRFGKTRGCWKVRHSPAGRARPDRAA